MLSTPEVSTLFRRPGGLRLTAAAARAGSFYFPLFSRQIVVNLGAVLVALEVLSVDQTLDAFLEVNRLHTTHPTHKRTKLNQTNGRHLFCARNTYLARELELAEELGHERRVAEGLTSFHDAHDGSIDLVLPVSEDLLLAFHLLLDLRTNV
jgi:hypothetical protein